MKYCCKIISFWDKCIWIGWGKFPVLWWEYLGSANNGLRYGPETTHLRKTHAFQLYLCDNVEKVG